MNWRNIILYKSSLSFFAGILFWLAFLPSQLPYFSAVSVIFALSMLYWAWANATPLQAFIRSVLFGMPAYIGGLSWLFSMAGHIGNEQGNSVVILYIALGLALFSFALLLGVMGALYARLSKYSDIVLSIILFALCWTVFEWLVIYWLTGFPVLHVGYAMIDTPLSSIAPVTGVLGISFVTAIFAASLTLFIRYQYLRLSVTVLVGVCIVIVFILGQFDWTTPSADKLQVALIHSDVSQAAKHERYRVIHAVKRYTELSEAAPETDLIIWPESSSAYALEDIYPLVSQRLVALAKRGTTLFMGGYLKQGTDTINVLVNGADLDVAYRKRHLIPYAEYSPLSDSENILPQVQMNRLKAGEDIQPLLKVMNIPFASMICYESLFGGEQRDQWKEAQFSVVASDLAWFDGTVAAPQLAQVSRMRALESAKPLVQSTNQGITLFVNYKGELIHSVSGQRQRLDGVIIPRRGATPYVTYGDVMLLLLMIIFISIALLISYHKNSFSDIE